MPAAEHNEPITVTAEMPSFAELRVAEDCHFWFRARNRVIGRLVERLTSALSPGYQVLEVGCGTGNVLRVLEKMCRFGSVTGSDLYEEGLQYARQRVHCPVVQADIYRLPFTTPFDLIGMFDVLEHLPDDRRAVTALYTALRPGGRLLLTVPAYMALWSHVDECAGHYRRYAPAELATALHDAGFRVEMVSPFMMVLAPLMWMGRRFAAWRNHRRESQVSARTIALREFQVSPVVNGVVEWLLGWEARWLARGWRLPFGSSLLAIATRPMELPASAAA